MLPDSALVRRGDVCAHLGVSKDVVRRYVKQGVLQELHFEFGEDGKPVDRAFFRRRDVEGLVEGGCDGCRDH